MTHLYYEVSGASSVLLETTTQHPCQCLKPDCSIYSPSTSNITPTESPTCLSKALVILIFNTITCVPYFVLIFFFYLDERSETYVST